MAQHWPLRRFLCTRNTGIGYLHNSLDEINQLILIAMICAVQMRPMLFGSVVCPLQNRSLAVDDLAGSTKTPRKAPTSAEAH